MDRPPAAAPATPRRTRVVGLLALVALGLAACGVRLDTPPPTPAPPDAVEEVRQAAAVDAEELARLAEAAAGAGGPETILTAVADGSEAQADALGGRWEPWPSASPTGGEPSPTTVPTPATDATAVLDALVAGAAEARSAALETTDGDLAGVLGAVAVWRTVTAAELAETLGADVSLPTGTPYPPSALAEWEMDSGTVLVLDSARYAYEVVAARADGDPRAAAAARADHLHDLSDAGVAALGDDPRRGVYDLGEAEDAAALAARAEEAVLGQLLFRLTLTGRDGREGVLDAALDAAERLEAWGGDVPPTPAG